MWPFASSAQQCQLSLKGVVQDEHTREPLHLVNIYVKEIGTGVVSDEQGRFEIKDLCAGEYHIVYSHIGCETIEEFLVLSNDTSVIVEMDHSAHLLEGVTISESSGQRSTQSIGSVSEQSIKDNSEKNLSTLISSISGVSTLRNGSGIAKPIVHGLFGNRVTILNNGVAQSGQQWGNDHAPEIDPLIANNIKVIKGVASLRYPGGGLGSVVSVEPYRINQEPHLHGRAGYYYESNGRTHGANIQLQKNNSKIGWKASGSFKLGGDRRSPNYFLTNTDVREANFALQLEKPIDDSWLIELYASTFNTTIGVLRGSHIGNLTDLESAFVRDIPFFTEESFNYQINAPRQEVHHHLLKSKIQHYINENDFLEFTLAGQFNDRQEFDIRRGGRSDIPSLSIQQYNWYGEARWHTEKNDRFSYDLGFQFNVEDNVNEEGTGILPLIPNYLTTKVGGYLTSDFTQGNSTFTGGLRYDFVYQSVITITTTLPKEILPVENEFNNISAGIGWSQKFSSFLNMSFNAGYITRNPAINELFSAGLHQGVSGIEEGNADLNVEKAIKGTLSLQGSISDNFSYEILGYYQSIDDYIFLNPSRDFRVTIRGAFPVFTYEQTDARIRGVDASAQLHLHEGWHVKTSYSYIRGDDRSENIPLVFIPSNNWNGSIAYEWHDAVQLGGWRLENLSLSANGKIVARQNHLLDEQDFLPAPEGYFLLGADLSTDIQMNKNRWRFVLRVDNLLNTTYRDYLNRLRYFADDDGINVVVGLGLKF